MATKSTKSSTKGTDDAEGFTAEERAAMKQRAEEARTEARRAKSNAKQAEKDAEAEREVLAKIAEMPDDDRVIAERLHELVKEHAPSLTARTWYGFPAYAQDGKVLAFYQPAAKFGARYGTLGFQDVAALDDGNVWPTSFAITKLTKADEKRIGELLARAAG